MASDIGAMETFVKPQTLSSGIGRDMPGFF
jgi:hypothetical protein